MSHLKSMGNCKSKKQDSVDCQNNLGRQFQQHNHRGQPPNGHTGFDNIWNTNLNHHNQHSTTEPSFEEAETITAQCNNMNLTSSNKNNSIERQQQQSTQNNSPQSATSASASNYNRKKTANEAVFDSTRAEVSNLLEGINEFKGTSQDDKDYRYFDEMLTRCILNLDQIECNDLQDRTNRKDAIRGVNEAISILERKLEINSEIKELESDLKRED